MSYKLKIIEAELEKIPHKIVNGNAVVLCPYHEDSNPSFSINIDDTKRKVPLGWGRCWSCSASCNWNTFAPLLGLKTFSKKDAVFDKGYAKKAEKGLKEKLLGEKEKFTIHSLVDKLECVAAELVSEDYHWRGYSGDYLKNFGCHVALDKNDNKVLIIPVYINEILVGATKAFWEKPKSKKIPSYIHMKGGWVKHSGLFPYDYVENMLTQSYKNYVIIVEGVRDALRLIKEGEPALCIFGTQTWTEEKLKLIKMLGVDTIVIMMDSGKAGIESTNKILEETKGKIRRIAIKMKNYQIQYEKKKDKKVKEMDPHNAPKSVMRKILKEIAEKT